MEIILVIGYTFLFLFIVQRSKFFPADNVSKKIFYAAFVLKVFGGIAYGIIFTRYIPQGNLTDSFLFFRDSKILFDSIFSNPKHFFEMLTGINGSEDALNIYYNKMVSWNNTSLFFNDNQIMIRMNAFFRLFSLGYYNVHVVFVSFLSMAGLTGIFKVFYFYLKEKKTALLIAVFFIPSTIFWTSALLKDGVMLFGLGILFFSFHKIVIAKSNAKNILLFIFSFVFLLFMKFYILFALLPGLIGWYWCQRKFRFSFLKFISLYVIYFFLLFNAWRVIPGYELHDFIYWKQKNAVEEAERAHARTFIQLGIVERNPWSVIAHAPTAFATTLTRPAIFEARNFTLVFAAIENFLMLVFFILSLITMKKKSIQITPLFFVCVFFVAILYALIGLVTPVLGGIVRYRAAILPFLLLIFISVYEEEKLKRIFSWKKSKEFFSASLGKRN